VKKTMLFLLLIATTYAQQATMSATHAEPGWTALFDGRTLSGWSQEQGAKWRVSGGVLVGDAGDDGWLRSSQQFTNFVLRIEYRNTPKGNSGVFLRATQTSDLSDPSNPAGSYELQIYNEDKKWPTGTIENFVPRLVPVNPAPNQWHAYEVEVRGNHLVATLDGTKVLDGRDSKFKSGYIGLQHHKDNKIEFRNISVKRLPD
jgi:hypothetical protein